MGASCTFSLNSERFSTFVCDGTGYQAFTGNGSHRNNPRSQNVPNDGPTPEGRYYLVQRTSGGRLGFLYDYASGRDEWFALYRDDGTVDDVTFIDGARRGELRLHPKGPSGTSLGCIVIEKPAEYAVLRAYLLAQPIEYIPGTGTRSFGIVNVTAPVRLDTLDPRYRPGGASQAQTA
jgi:hypothetical protein